MSTVSNYSERLQQSAKKRVNHNPIFTAPKRVQRSENRHQAIKRLRYR